MKSIILFICTLWCLTAPLSYGQTGPLEFVDYGDDDGLLSNTVNDLAKDSCGYLWLATNRGLHRFDGYQFKAYLHEKDNPNSLPDNYATTVFVDSQNRIWVGTQEGGVALLDRRAGTFTNYYNDLEHPTLLTHNMVTGIGQLNDGRIIATTVYGYNIYDDEGRTFTGFIPNHGITGLSRANAPEERLTKILKGAGISPSSTYFVDLPAGNLALSLLSASPTPTPPALSKAQAHAPRTAQERLEYWLDQVYPAPAEAKLAFFVLFPGEAGDRLWPVAEELLLPEDAPGSTFSVYADISTLYVDSLGDAYFGYGYGGVGVLRAGRDSVEIIRYCDNPRVAVEQQQVQGLLRDRDTLYIGKLHAGLQAMDVRTGLRLRHGVSSTAVSAYKMARRGEELFFTTTSGMHVYNHGDGTTKIYDNHRGVGWTMVASECSVVLPDDDGVIWLGHFSHGLSKAAPAAPFYSHPDPTNEPELPEYMRSASALHEDSRGRLWVGYFEGGIRELDARTLAVRNIHLAISTPEIERSTIFSIFESSDGQLWAGSYGNGLLWFDESRQEWTNYPRSEEILGGNDVRAIAEDQEGRLYIAVHHVGITELNLKTGDFRRFDAKQGQAFSPYVFDLSVDERNQVWMATVSGLYRLSTDRATVDPIIVSELGHPDDFTHRVNSVAAVGSSIWVGTQEGLLAMDLDGCRLPEMTLPPALSKEIISSVQAQGDENNKIWVGQKGSLYCIDPVTESYTTYVLPAHFGVKQFRRNAATRLQDGRLLFGYDNGFLSFDPDALTDPPMLSAPVISNVEVFEPDGRRNNIQLPPSAALSLPHDNLGVSIDLSTLYFPHPEAVRYQARLLPLQDEWLDIDGELPRYTLYHLPPGDHRMEFRAALKNGLEFSEPTAVTLEVASPWYSSWPAYLAYLLLIGAGLYGYRRFLKRQAALQQSVAIARIRAENTREMADSKARFFVNVSHELRTPLTLIGGPLTELMKGGELEATKRQRLYELMERNIGRLRRLVDRLLDVQRVENATPELQLEEGDVFGYLRMLADSFQSQAGEAGIELQVSLPREIIRLTYSAEVLDRICTNLISNALKFTQDGGAVRFSAELAAVGEAGRQLRIEVADNGPGIPKDEQQYLFERFYRGENGEHADGSGVGLSIVRQYVELAGGQIECLSDIGEGTTFICTLPVQPAVVELAGKNDESGGEAVLPAASNVNLPHLLIVDDDADIRQLLRIGCEGRFRVTEAPEGTTALDLARQLQPDLVLTDLMMPGLDGVDLCRSLKADPLTSHLPVLLLTARHSDAARIAALDAGANDFLLKPFDLDHVRSKIENTLTTLDAARRRWLSQPEALDEGVLTAVDADAEFLRTLRGFVEENMDNADLSTDDLLRRLAVSRSVCYTKVKSLTGLPLKAFIKQLRIGRARQLLEQTELAVGEVAYRTGFKTTQHFSRSFKEVVGASPTAFRESLGSEV